MDSRGGFTGTLTADPPPTAELVDRKLGEFVLRECIGEGGFGAVYRADQPLLGPHTGALNDSDHLARGAHRGLA
jgi:hypothetical protein